MRALALMVCLVATAPALAQDTANISKAAMAEMERRFPGCPKRSEGMVANSELAMVVIDVGDCPAGSKVGQGDVTFILFYSGGKLLQKPLLIGAVNDMQATPTAITSTTIVWGDEYDDPHCCPAHQQRLTASLMHGKLVLTKGEMQLRNPP